MHVFKRDWIAYLKSNNYFRFNNQHDCGTYMTI